MSGLRISPRCDDQIGKYEECPDRSEEQEVHLAGRENGDDICRET
jgi:hypothetical protein